LQKPRLQRALELIWLQLGETQPDAVTSDEGIEALICRLESGAGLSGVVDIEPALDEMYEAVSALARLDFSRTVQASGVHESLDAVADGLNMLGEELQISVVSRHYLDSIVHSMGEALFVVSETGQIQDTNRQASALTGATRRELSGQTVTELFGDNAVSAIHGAAASGAGQVELTLVRRDNIAIPVRLTVTRMEQSGSVTCLVVDVSEQRETEAALATARDHALALAHQRSMFLANMSHELRTPINGVIGMTSLLLQTALDTRQLEMGRAIRSSGRALLDVINDVLDFSKIDAGHLDLEVLEFDLHEVIHEVLDVHAFQAARKGLELVAETSPHVPVFVRGDPARLRQVLNNLLGNAIKFTPKGEIALKVTRGAAGTRFAVRDTGVGIPDGKIASLFDAFSQGDASVSREYGGTGLGLAISRDLVRLMGGRLRCESTLGSGSVFDFEIRLPEVAEQDVSGWYGDAGLEDARVLIVDDNAANRRVLAMQIESWGARYATANNAEEGLGLLRAATRDDVPFDLAILDMQMPGGSGLDLARAITTDDSIGMVGLLLLTSLDVNAHLAQTRRAGISRVLTKPARPRMLKNALCQIITGRVESTGSASSSSRFFRPARILVVEDNAINRKVATGYLERFGLQSHAVGSGEEALTALEEASFDIILMDIRMPGMDGFDTTLRIVELYGSRAPAIVGLTADVSPGIRERCIEVGMLDYLPKPITEARLRAALRQHIPLQPGQDQPAPRPLDEAALDPSRIEKLIELGQLSGNQSLVHEVVDHFIDSVFDSVDSLWSAAAHGDHEALSATAHSLKGSAWNLGAVDVGKLAGELEAMGETQNIGEAAPTLNALLGAVQAVIPLMDEARRPPA
jgi:PAS domain S-box-containing protein